MTHGPPRREIPAVTSAYEGLCALVSEAALTTEQHAASARGGEGGKIKVREWYEETCRGNPKLAGAARLALEYELASSGDDEESALLKLRTLNGLWHAAFEGPGEAASDEPVEVRLPERTRRRTPGARGFRMGELSIMAEEESTGWHLSVSHPSRYPSLDEMFRSWRATGTDATEGLWCFAGRPGTVQGTAGGRIVHAFERVPSDYVAVADGS